jgi:L-alanine-DL-glutamate epimerase-like enolase superfamily enzyme
LGEVRDDASEVYALFLKSRILGKNPCNVEMIFKNIKQFGGHGRKAGGVCGIEMALWDLAGKAFNVPVYQMLGGRYRDKIRIYTLSPGTGSGPESIGENIKSRMAEDSLLLKFILLRLFRRMFQMPLWVAITGTTQNPIIPTGHRTDKLCILSHECS